MRLVSLLITVLLLLLSAACSPTSAAPPRSEPQALAPQAPGAASTSLFPATIADNAGRQVVVPKQPRRIVSLSASNTEILFALGLDDRIVGVDDYSDFPVAARDKPRVGGFASPDIERVVAREPDLVLASPIHVKMALPDLERRGLTVVVVDAKDVRGVEESVRMVGRATGEQQAAEALAGQMKARMDSLESRLAGVKPVRVFYELSPSLHTAGAGTFVDDMIRLAGGTNIAATAGAGWPQLNQESLFVSDPEVILLADHAAAQTPEQVLARPGWKQITAVKTGRVFTVDPNLTNRAGPRVVDGVELVAKMLHPESFK